MRVYKKIIIGLLLLLLFTDKTIALDMNKSAEQRVIYEQNMSYDDVCQMKTIVEKMERQKETEKTSDEQVNPIMEVINNNPEQNSNMVQILKTLLKTMGVNNIPENLDEQQGLAEGAKSGQKGESDFKAWDGRHNWKGIRSEQR